MKRRTFLVRGGLGGLALSLPLNALMAQDREFSADELTGKANIELFGKDINLRKEAHDAFIEMKKAAYQDGIDIKVVSSFRDYERQRAIFERKYVNYTEDGMEPLEAVDEIVKYSTIPGTSRHHWGTDADLIDGSKRSEGDVLVADKFEAGGPFEDFKNWMDAHSEEYGFFLVYTDTPKRRGLNTNPGTTAMPPFPFPCSAPFGE